MLEALVKNSIIYWCPLIIASMVGHEHVPSSGALIGCSKIFNSTENIGLNGSTHHDRCVLE